MARLLMALGRAALGWRLIERSHCDAPTSTQSKITIGSGNDSESAQTRRRGKRFVTSTGIQESKPLANRLDQAWICAGIAK